MPAPQSYYPFHTDLQIPSASSDLRSPHSVHSPTSSFSQSRSSTSPAYPIGHSPSCSAVPTVVLANPHYHQSMAMSHASLERNLPGPQAAAQLPYARAPPASSSVPHDIPAKTPEPTVKRRIRPDARQSEALNRVFCCTAKPSTEQQLQLANELNMSRQRVQTWLAHIFVCMYYS